MIVTNCPLRISLFGGSTDNPLFIEKYGYGSVISFTCNLKTYVTIHEDKIGYNKHLHKYVLNYSTREEKESIEEIKNDVIRVVLDKFKVEPLTISLTSDVYSQGSGLASSSSYIIALVKAFSIHKKINLTDTEICSIAYSLEQKFNPYCGLQDPYGCGIGGFKRIEFFKGENIKFTFLSTKLFEIYDTHLIFTGVNRDSKNVLKDVSDNIHKSKELLAVVDEAHKCLLSENYSDFLEYINESWTIKKRTSNLIVENENVKQIDEMLKNNDTVLSYKLCGAGNGGFYLAFSLKDTLNISLPHVKINVNTTGVSGVHL